MDFLPALLRLLLVISRKILQDYASEAKVITLETLPEFCKMSVFFLPILT